MRHSDRPDRELVDYRSRLTRLVPFICLFLALAVLVPSFFIDLSGNQLRNMVADGAAILELLALALASKKFKRLPSFGILAVTFSLGTFFLLEGGVYGLGQAWLGASIVLAAVFLGSTGAIVFAAAAFLVFGLLALGMAEAAQAFMGTRGRIIELGIGTMGLALASSLAVSRLLRFLEQAVGARDRFHGELQARESALQAAAAGRRGAEALAAFYRDFDSLTKLPNRQNFLRELGHAMRHAERRERSLGVICMGLDRFSRVTDSYGHEVGDELLVTLASAMRAAFRDDDVVARVGDRMFAVICTDLRRAEDVLGPMEKARKIFEGSFTVPGGLARLQGSMGVALWPGDGDSAVGLLCAAESAQRLARETRPGSFRFFDSRVHGEFVEMRRMENELDGALERGDIVPWFQAKVDRSGRIVGAEALARWNLPGGIVRQPGLFIPVAETTGGIIGLGKAILARACAHAAAWAADGLAPIPISVNLSPFQFRNPDLVRDVGEALSGSGLDPARLELEITESGIAAVEDEAVARLAELKALGVSLSIDDFGTGASSISRLRDYPIDAVKVPKAFVDPLPLDDRASMIARAVIELAHNLDFAVIAEGIEDRRQFDWLREASCDQYQGFLFAPPMPADSFAATLARGFGAIVE